MRRPRLIASLYNRMSPCTDLYPVVLPYFALQTQVLPEINEPGDGPRMRYLR